MLKQIIDDFINQNNSIAAFISETNDLYQDRKEVIPMFVDKLKATQFNAELAISFTQILQMSDNKKFYTQFELEDIRRLYDSTLKLQETNIEGYIEAAYFEFSVMDNAPKAKEIITNGIEMATRKLKELKSLLDQINQESN